MAEKLVRKSQVLVKTEATAGTAETLTAAEGKTRVYVGASANYEAPKEKRDIARATLTNLGMLSSTKAIPMSYKCEVNTPDTITDALEFAASLEACGLGITALRRIPIGAITSGPIARGATMTGGTSAAVGRVVKKAVNGDTHVYFAITSGTFQAEALTFTGGASATSSGISALWGWRVNPISSAMKTVTARYEEDGYEWTARGAMGNLTAEFQSSRAGMFEFSLNGPKQSYGDQALTASIDFDEEEPPIMQTAGLFLGTFAPVFRSINIDLGNNVVLRENGNAAGDSGFETARITAREPKMTIVLEHEDEADYDFFGTLDANTKIATGFQVGATPGKIFAFYGDYAQIESIGMEDNEGIRNLSVVLALTGAASSSEDEFEMLFI
jgi:hypothetical protein